MPIVAMDALGFTDRCIICGSLNGYRWDRGSTKFKPGPYKLDQGAHIVMRIDDNGPNLGKGQTYDIQLTGNDLSALSTEELKKQLTDALPVCDIEDDGGGLLVVSKTSGPTSCVEPLLGPSMEALVGYQVDPTWHWGVGRPCLGFTPSADHPSKGLAVIILRKCSCRSLPHLVVPTDDADLSKNPSAFLNFRINNTIAKYMYDNGYFDQDLTQQFADTRFPWSDNYFQDFPNKIHQLPVWPTVSEQKAHNVSMNDVAYAFIQSYLQ
jgi:hypothetical protein